MRSNTQYILHHVHWTLIVHSTIGLQAVNYQTIYCFSWSYDKALALFMENTALPPKFIQNEVTRYCTWPAQVRKRNVTL